MMEKIVLVREMDEGKHMMLVHFNATEKGATEAIHNLEALGEQISQGMRFQIHELLSVNGHPVVGCEVDIKPDMSIRRLSKRSKRRLKDSLILQVQEQARNILR